MHNRVNGVAFTNVSTVLRMDFGIYLTVFNVYTSKALAHCMQELLVHVPTWSWEHKVIVLQSSSFCRPNGHEKHNLPPPSLKPENNSDHQRPIYISLWTVNEQWLYLLRGRQIDIHNLFMLAEICSLMFVTSRTVTVYTSGAPEFMCGN